MTQDEERIAELEAEVSRLTADLELRDEELRSIRADLGRARAETQMASASAGELHVVAVQQGAAIEEVRAMLPDEAQAARILDAAIAIPMPVAPVAEQG